MKSVGDSEVGRPGRCCVALEMSCITARVRSPTHAARRRGRANCIRGSCEHSSKGELSNQIMKSVGDSEAGRPGRCGVALEMSCITARVRSPTQAARRRGRANCIRGACENNSKGELSNQVMKSVGDSEVGKLGRCCVALGMHCIRARVRHSDVHRSKGAQ